MTLKPWLATYRDNGIPETVNADAWPSVVHLLEDAMRRYADKPAFRAFGQTLSFADVDRQSAAFAAWLQQRLTPPRWTPPWPPPASPLPIGATPGRTPAPPWRAALPNCWASSKPSWPR